MFQNFVIVLSSMVSTLLVGDHVMVVLETLTPATKWVCVFAEPESICPNCPDNSAVACSRAPMTGEFLRGLKRDDGPEMLMAAIAVPCASRIGAPIHVASKDPSPRSNA